MSDLGPCARSPLCFDTRGEGADFLLLKFLHCRSRLPKWTGEVEGVLLSPPPLALYFWFAMYDVTSLSSLNDIVLRLGPSSNYPLVHKSFQCTSGLPVCHRSVFHPSFSGEKDFHKWDLRSLVE